MIKSALKYAALLSLVALTTCGNWALDFDELWATAGKAFSPLSISDCHLWLDASDASTVLADGTAVTNWIDKSTAGNHAVQISADATRPTVCPAEQNGLCTIAFDGGDYLKTDCAPSVAITIFTVAKFAATGGSQMLYGSRGDLSSNDRNYLGKVSGTDKITAFVGKDTSIRSDVDWGTNYRLTALIYNGTTVYLRDGGEQIFSKAQNGTGANTRGYLIGGADQGGFASLLAACNFAEMLVYKRVLTASERGQVEAYLIDKWGL